MPRNKLYYIYVLKLGNGGRYVGATRNVTRRLREHFDVGGSVATRESRPIAIEIIYSLNDYKIGAQDAHYVAEVMIANDCEESYGNNSVRGAQHGMGWGDSPSKNQEKIIRRIKKLSLTDDGTRLRNSLTRYDYSHFDFN